MKEASWRIDDIWNTKLRVDRTEPKERDYISPSDIGKPYLDRYYKMTGEKITNPFDERILRIFDAGNIFEWVVEKVFSEAGILEEAQKWVIIEANDKHFKVMGKLDHLVGGLPDWETARKRIKAEKFPEWLENRALKLTEELEKKYPKGLKRIIAEIKSVNSMAFWAHKNRDDKGRFKGYPHHKLQLYSYLKGENIDEGHLFYISKDDLTLEETPVFLDDPELQKVWLNDVTQISEYVRTKTVPAKEDDIVFNDEKGKWEPNWKVGRSSYLTKITGAKDQESWEAGIHQEILDRNKALRKKAKEEANNG